MPDDEVVKRTIKCPRCLKVTDVNVGMDIMLWIREHEVKCRIKPSASPSRTSDDGYITTCPACGQCSDSVCEGPHMIDGEEKTVCIRCDYKYLCKGALPRPSRCKSVDNLCFCNYEYAVSKKIVCSGVVKEGYCKLCYGPIMPIGFARVNGADHPDWEARQYHKKCWVKANK